MSRCPLAGHTLIDPTFCPVCVVRITRNDRGEVERAHRRNPATGQLQVVFQRRPNAASALELPGPRVANLHNRNLERSADIATLDRYMPGGDAQALTKGDAAA